MAKLVSVVRDFDTDEIVIRLPKGEGAGGFARFLTTAADGLENGKILPTNPNPDPRISLTKACDSIRSIADKIHRHNNA